MYIKYCLHLRKYPADNYVCESIYSFQQTQGFDQMKSKESNPKNISLKSQNMLK